MQRLLLFSLILTLFTLLYPTQSFSKVIHIPGDSLTIQAGINGAADGDTVLVADGTYTGQGNRDIEFFGKAIVVKSENGPEVTIIDCEGSEQEPHRGFAFRNREGPGSKLQGFTITNGWSRYGGGIACWNFSSPTIEGNTITGNTAEYGAGIRCDYSPAIIRDNLIAYNTALVDGGGIRCYDALVTIEGNTIVGNTAADVGGGIYCYYSSPSVENNTIIGNVAGYGGGIGCYYTDPIIRGNTITYNTATDDGGGIYSTDFSPTISANKVSNNTAGDIGGGIYCHHYCSPIINDNTVAGNTANHGGGIGLGFNSSPFLDGNTITDNTAIQFGGGIFNWYSSGTAITSTIVWANHAMIGPQIWVGDASFPSILIIAYSDVEGGRDSVYVEPGCTLYWGPGMLDADPLFVLPERLDYRLLWESPCINAGYPDSLDPDGSRRDQGAFYFDLRNAITIYLTPDKARVEQGDQLGVTYTAINKWSSEEDVLFESNVTLPNGNTVTILGPDLYTLPPHHTIQIHMVHDIPQRAPLGDYMYRSLAGFPRGFLIDEDCFEFRVIEPDRIINEVLKQ